MSDYNDLELQEQLMSQLEEMQMQLSKKDLQLSEALDKAESLYLELKNLQSRTSSEKQELELIVQQQKKKIAEQAEQIEKLNNSDVIFQQNQELEKQNTLLQKNIQNALAEVEAVRSEYSNRERQLQTAQEKAEQERKETEAYRRSLNEQVYEQARLRSEILEKQLKQEYQARTLSHQTFFVVSLLYGIIVTLFTAFYSDAFIRDFKAFFDSTWTFICLCTENLFKAANWASRLGDMVPHPVASMVIHCLLWILMILLLGVGSISLLAICAIKGCKHYANQYADTISLSVWLLSLACLIWFGDFIRNFIPINLVVLLFLIHTLYLGIRAYLKRNWYRFR